jgi:hypothetical protein
MKNFICINICVLLCALTSACGKAPKVDVGTFSSYVAKFENKSDQEGKPVRVTELIIQFGSMANPNERGVCVIDGENPPTITIDQANWDTMEESRREALLFHELGHCVLKQTHRNGTTGAGIPSSVMNTYLLDAEVYQLNEAYYTRELFVN